MLRDLVTCYTAENDDNFRRYGEDELNPKLESLHFQEHETLYLVQVVPCTLCYFYMSKGCTVV